MVRAGSYSGKIMHGDGGQLIILYHQITHQKKRTIIAGSRDFNNIKLAYDVLKDFKDQIKVVLCGEAKGADTIGRQWAEENHISIYSYPADWQKYPTAAGYIRNKQMGDAADMLIAFWDEVSPGTKHMIEYMKELGKEVYIIPYKTIKQIPECIIHYDDKRRIN